MGNGDEDESLGPDQLQDEDRQRYEKREHVAPGQLAGNLRKLELFADDMFMVVQASRLDMVDQFILSLEANVLNKLLQEERTPPEAHFLAAQSEMWIFALYELLRTWKQRAHEFDKLAKNAGFANKIASLKAVDDGYEHHGRMMRVAQFERAVADPSIVERLREHLRHIHMPFALLEHLRVAIAKHEVSGKTKGIAFFPGYGRINTWSGSLDYELENGKYILREISRRDVADAFRGLDLAGASPSDAQIKDFDAWLTGKGGDIGGAEPGSMP